ncbi:MAG: long-chain-fatty-acid--CoA ligase [Bordetella sp.]|jgi:long-chain acyl-CoA synthetase
MERIWLKQYPPEVPASISTESIPSLTHLIDEALAEFADKPAYISMGKAMTYRELNNMAEAFAAWLQSLGLGRGDRVALMMPNLLPYPIALVGTLRAGCVVVNCNPLYTTRELEHQLVDSGATAIVIVENFAHTLEKVIHKTAVRHVVVTSLGEMLGGAKGFIVNLVVRHVKKLVPAYNLPQAIGFKNALSLGGGHKLNRPSLGPEDIAFLQYTGGTTGVSKGAILTHANISANVLQAEAWIKPVVRRGEEFILTALPLYHIFALTANCLTFMRIGAQNLLITNPRDIPNFIKEWAKYPITTITGVNTLFNALLNHPEFKTLNFSTLRLTLGGGMAVQQPVADRWQATTGVVLSQAYGLTETSPAATINLITESFNGSIGLPISSTDVSIRDDEGRDLAQGEIGEICIKGPQVTAGYWNRPDETSLIFTGDGYLKTGDMGYFDEKGYIFIVDRKKDMILVSGFNVYPNEVEEAAAEHPGIREAAAIGVPDPQCGEAVKLFVVRKDPSLNEEAITAHCRSLLTNYKVPKHIEFREELPKTNVGKILRRALREPATSETTN